MPGLQRGLPPPLPTAPENKSACCKPSGTIRFNLKDSIMDKVKASYAYVVSWVAAHPAATVNAIVAIAVLQVVAKIFL
jgi:hypothetical protein